MPEAVLPGEPEVVPSEAKPEVVSSEAKPEVVPSEVKPEVLVTVMREVTKDVPAKASPPLWITFSILFAVLSTAGLSAAIILLPVQRGSSSPASSTRIYHVAVEEVAWSYAPSGYDNCTGQSVASSPHAAIFALPDAAKGLIGDTYWRRRYVSYEPDGTFSTPIFAARAEIA